MLMQNFGGTKRGYYRIFESGVFTRLGQSVLGKTLSGTTLSQQQYSNKVFPNTGLPAGKYKMPFPNLKDFKRESPVDEGDTKQLQSEMVGSRTDGNLERNLQLCQYLCS